MERIIRIKELLDVVGLSRSTIYRSMKKKLFPKPVKLTEGSIGWKESQINKWMKGRKNDQRN